MLDVKIVSYYEFDKEIQRRRKNIIYKGSNIYGQSFFINEVLKLG